MDQFLIGDLLLKIDYAGMPVLSEGNLQRFRHTENWSGEQIVLKCSADNLAQYMTTPFIQDNFVYGVYTYKEEKLLVYHWGNRFHGFAVWPSRFSVTFDPKMYQQPALREDWFFSICSFHHQLLIRNACILHAAYIDAGGKAILFTGPSNVGKSTQADLWRQCADAEIINGDRVLLREKNGQWNAYGYPSCGTSGICLNRNLPVAAIVVLEQAPENQVCMMTASQKVRALVAATEVYLWDQEEIEMAFRAAQEIVSKVPVIRLRCRPDADAVHVLRTFLEENHYV